MSWLIIGVCILGGLIWLVGSYTTLCDLMDSGKSLKEYREKYGKDLGMLVCCTYRGATVFAWPIVGLIGFSVGLIRDTIKLVFGK